MPRPPRCPVDPAHGPMTVRAFTYCPRCRGGTGGRSRSAAKQAAGRVNIRKAIAARRQRAE